MIRVASLVFLAAAGVAEPQDLGVPAPPPSPSGLLATAPLLAGQREQIKQALDRHDYRLASSLLSKQVDATPDAPGLLTLAGRVYLLDKNPLNAAIAFKRSEQYAPLSVEDRFSLALALAGIRRGDLAREEFNHLAAGDPSNPAFQYWLGRLDYDDRLYESAVKRFKIVTAAKPEFMRAWDNLALSLEGTGNLDEALECYDKAVTLNRAARARSPWPPLNQGTLLTRFGRLEEADQLLREAIEYNSGLAVAHYRLGANLHRQNHPEEAVVELRKAAELAPQDPGPLYLLGQIYTSQGNKDAAAQAFERFRQLKKAQRPDD